MSCSRRCTAVWVGLAAAALWISGCSRKVESEGIVRLAVPPAENLSGKPELEWVGYGVGQVVASCLMGAGKVHPISVRDARDAAAAGAAQVLLIQYTESSGGLRFHAELRKLRTQKTDRTFDLVAPASDAALRAGQEIARRISTTARSFGTRNSAALQAYAEGFQEANAEKLREGLERAVAVDPNFGEAWVALVETLAESGQSDAARAAVAKARTHASAIHAIERARLDWLAASLDGDAAAQAAAIENLAKLLPHDPVTLAAAARAEQAARHYASAAGWFRKAAAAEPQNPQWWNLALYASAFAGDWAGVKAAFEAYRRAAPDNPNAFDSLGEAAFYLGRFSEAERAFLDGHRLNPSFLNGLELYKAALARWLSGDLPGAKNHFEKFIEQRTKSNDPMAGYLKARWDYITGQPAEAVRSLQDWIQQAPEGDARALGLAQLAVWNAAGGDWAAAARMARQAFAQARTPVARSVAASAVYLAQPEAVKTPPETWKAYGWLVRKRFGEAVPLLERIASRGAPTETGNAAALLAWAYLESGKRQEAKTAAEHFPIPGGSAEDLFEFLIYPRILEIRRELGLTGR